MFKKNGSYISDSYEHALRKEKRLMEDKSNTESENLGRGLRQKKLSYRLTKENGNFYRRKIGLSLITI